jgi:hypothetical protein
MYETKELFRNNLKTSKFRWFPLKFSIHWLTGEKHRTYQPARWWEPEWKFRIYWSGSIEKPCDHILLFFHRLEFFINTPKIIVTYKKWRRKVEMFKYNKLQGFLCPDCGSHKLLPSRGMAYEPIIFCDGCGMIVWEADPEPYIR